MSKLETLLAISDEKKFGEQSLADAFTEMFTKISEHLRNYTPFLKDIEEKPELMTKLTEVLVNTLDRTGKLSGSNCKCMALVSAYSGEGDKVIDAYSDKLSTLLSAVKLETFSSGDDDDTTRLSNVPLHMINCRAAIGFFSDKEPAAATRIVHDLVFLPKNRALRAARNNPEAFAAGINAWTTLLTLQRSEDALAAINELLPFFHGILGTHSLDPEVYLSCALALALGEELVLEDSALDSIQFDTLEILQGAQADFESGRSRKEKRAEATYDQILEFFESGEVPHEKIMVGRDGVVTDSWQQLVRFNFIRSILEGGLQPHLKNNEIYPEIFQFARSTRQRGRVGKKEYLDRKNDMDKTRDADRRDASAAKRVYSWRDE